MTVTPAQIGRELTPPRTPTAAESEQWSMWIGDAEMLISLRAKQVGIEFSTLDTTIVDFVVRKAVAAIARNPNPLGISQQSKTRSIDDGSVTNSMTFKAGATDVSISSDQWLMLGLVPTASAEAFVIDLLPQPVHSPRCSINLGLGYCDCYLAYGVVTINDQPW